MSSGSDIANTSIIGEVSTKNSTSTPLLAAGVFTGATEDIKNAGTINVAIYSNVASAASGLSFQFSTDGTNWDHLDTYSYIAGTGKTYSLQPVSRYFRIVYTNGGTNQTSFRLQTQIRSVYVKPSSHRVGDNISPEDDSELVKAVLAAGKPDGTFTPINATAGANLKVSVEEFDESLTTANADKTTNLDGEIGLNTNAMLFARVSDTVVKNARLDASTEALMTIMYEHHEIHAGTHYEICDVVDLAINNVFDMQFTTPNTTSWSHMTYMIQSEAETEIYIYEGATIITPGTAHPAFNNDRNSLNTTGNTIKVITNTSLANAEADTDTSAATSILHQTLGAGRTSQGANDRSRELILKQNTVYCFRAVATAAGYINFCLNWYEHQNRN